MTKKELISISVSAEIKTQVQRIAVVRGESVSAYIAYLLEQAAKLDPAAEHYVVEGDECPDG